MYKLPSGQTQLVLFHNVVGLGQVVHTPFTTGPVVQTHLWVTGSAGALSGQVVTQEEPLKYVLLLQEVHPLVPEPLQVVQLESQLEHTADVPVPFK